MEKRYYYLAAFLAFLIALIFDNKIALFMSHNRSVGLTIFFDAFTWAGTLIVIPFLIISYYFWKSKKKELIIPLWISLLASLAVTYLLKPSINRPRPEAALAAIKETGYSFPSAHATAAFSALPPLEKHLKSFNIILQVFAFLIAFSRVYLGVHYLSDIIAGAIIGYAVSDFVTRNINSRFIKRINILR